MRGAIICSSVLFLTAPQTSAFAANLCNDKYIVNLKEDVLYLDDNCSSVDCLKEVIPYFDGLNGHANVSLRSNLHYKFYYRTAETPVINSLVAVQIKHLGLIASPNGFVPRVANKPVEVNLERDATPFACDREENKKAYKYEENGVEKAVNYDTYDRFHRWGVLAADDDPVLADHFHIYYDNRVDWRCVRSDEGPRAALFLMHARDVIPKWYENIAYRYGVPSIAEHFTFTRAYAKPQSQREATSQLEEVTPFLKLKVLLTNYHKEKMKSGCFSFSVGTGLADPKERPTELDVSFSDLEESLSHYPHSRWNYQAIYKFLIQ